MKKSPAYFENLDGLRFVLAMVVFFSHARFGEALQRVVPFDWLDRLIGVFSSGPFGVSFFFVLSGFLITYLMMEEARDKGTVDLKKFFIRRVLRIWPLYYALQFFVFVVYPVVKVYVGYTDQNPYNVWYHLLFASNFDCIRIHHEGLVGVAPMMAGITWSVAIEEQFYLVWPLLFLLTGSRRFVWVIVVVIVSSALFGWYYNTRPEQYYHTLSVASDLGIGALLSYLCFHNQRFTDVVRSLRREWIVFFYVLGFTWLMYADAWPGESGALIARVVTAAFFAFIILEQNYASHSFFKIGRCKPLSSLGKYTYALYMLHPIGIQASIVLFRHWGFLWEQSFLHSVLYAAIALMVSLGLSLLSYRFFESYFLSLKTRFY